MYSESKRVLECTWFVGLLIACILSVAVTVSAQGWSSGAGTSDKSPDVAGKLATPSGKAAKSGKSATSTRARNKATGSKHSKETAAVAKTGSDSAANKGKGERRVNKTTAGSENPGGSTNKSTASVAKRPRAGRCDPAKEERTDLSGTYDGAVNYPAAGLDGNATLTITGNRFTLNSGSKTEAGNITAVTTCNYTAVAMMFGEWKTPQPGEPVLPPLPVLSLRAIKSGDRLGLKPSASERRVFSFDSGKKK